MPDMNYISSGVTSTGLVIGSRVYITLMDGAELINTTLGYYCRLYVNGDAKDDLLVRQYSTGMLGYYSTGDMAQWNVLGYGVGMEWTVIA